MHRWSQHIKMKSVQLIVHLDHRFGYADPVRRTTVTPRFGVFADVSGLSISSMHGECIGSFGYSMGSQYTFLPKILTKS